MSILLTATGSGGAVAAQMAQQPPGLVRRMEVAEGPPLQELLGTGGHVGIDLEHVFGTGSITYFCTFSARGTLRPEDQGGEALTAITIPATQIARVRATFNLSVKLLAEVIGVERPTVYGWIREERSPQPANMQRLGKLYELALAFNEVTSAPLPASALHVPVRGLTLVDVLRNPSATPAQVKEHAVDVVGQGKQRRRRSIRDMAQRHDMQLSEQGNGQRRIDALTGYVDE